MDRVKKSLGFGFMRLPMNGEEVNITECKSMVDAFLGAGFNYFDTAHGYVGEKSEIALRESLTSRYPRESYVLTDKLTENYFKKTEDIRPFFESQLSACGVDYFDFYLMHAQDEKTFAYFKSMRAYETALELKKEGKIRHFGISFHDTPEVLRKILTEYPKIEVVQIQFNYLDFEDPAVRSRGCYEVCREFGKPIIVMEPVKGGNLVRLPDSAKSIVEKLDISPANLAIRFAASYPGIFMVLSGMSDMAQMTENTAFMNDFHPLNERELRAVEDIRAVFASMNLIPCTACRYCTDGCPKNIPIPDLFAVMNMKKLYNSWNSDYYYNIHVEGKGRASDCISCGKCEAACPQHLSIRSLLTSVSAEFDGKPEVEK